MNITTAEGQALNRIRANREPGNVYTSFTQAAMDDVMALHPHLNDFGMGLPSDDQKLPADAKAAKLSELREVLAKSEAGVVAVINWMRANLQPIKNPLYSSYGLKHLANDDIGYVTNGVFILGAIIAGYTYKIQYPNPAFGVSKRSLARIRRARREAKQ
jgi:hypothetical protein